MWSQWSLGHELKCTRACEQHSHMQLFACEQHSHMQLSKLHADNLEGGLESSLSTLTRGQGLRLSFVRLGKVG